MIKTKSVHKGRSIIRSLVKTNDKCAPGLTYEDGHCARLSVLVELARAYNASHPFNKIRLTQEAKQDVHTLKRHIVNQLQERLKTVCTTHDCWSRQDFVDKMEDDARDEFVNFTLRPKSPQGRFTWLSNFDIDDVLEQYAKQYDFIWGGAVPMDFATLPTVKVNHINYSDLVSHGKTKFGMVLNLDESWKGGSHWVALFTDFQNGNVFYFDSYGVEPEKRVKAFMEKHKKLIQEMGLATKVTLDHNKTRHQYGGSECGVYSIWFLVHMLKGGNFNSLCKKPISDKRINKCRLEYFNYHKKVKTRPS